MNTLDVGSETQTVDDPVGRAAVELVAGRMVILRDDSKGRGEADLLVAAEHADAAALTFMATVARGPVHVALSTMRCEQLGIERISNCSEPSALRDSTMVSIELRDGVETRLSTNDRARAIAFIADPHSTEKALLQWGPVFLLRTGSNGLLERARSAKAAVDLTAGAGLQGVGVLCRVMRDDGHMARGDDLERFASQHGIVIVDVSAVAQRRRAADPTAAAKLPDTGRKMRAVMGHFATGVSVITARNRDLSPVGTTANAISSVSLDPPLLLACLSRSSETLGAIRNAHRFAVNVLAAEQRHHSDRFARKGEAVRSDEVEFDEHELGVPVLPDSLATVVCDVEAIYPAGDHEIVIGLARHLEHREPGASPLLFYRGSYSQIKDDELAA